MFRLLGQITLHMILRHFYYNICNLCVMVFSANEDLFPYKRVRLKHVLNIISFIRSIILSRRILNINFGYDRPELLLRSAEIIYEIMQDLYKLFILSFFKDILFQICRLLTHFYSFHFYFFVRLPS